MRTALLATALTTTLCCPVIAGDLLSDEDILLREQHFDQRLDIDFPNRFDEFDAAEERQGGLTDDQKTRLKDTRRRHGIAKQLDREFRETYGLPDRSEDLAATDATRCEPATGAEKLAFCAAAGLGTNACKRLDFSCPDAEKIDEAEEDTGNAEIASVRPSNEATRPVLSGDTVFVDDFNGGLANWSHNEPGVNGGHPGYGNVWDHGDGRNVEVRDGKLVLKVTECDNPGGKPMCGAEVTTRGKMDSFTHGRLEVRAKFDNAAGMWPGIWAMGDGQWPNESGEIDLMEVVNNGKDDAKPFFSTHWGGCGGKCQISDYNPPTLTNDYHTYVLERTPDRLRQIIDGQVYAEVTRAEAKAKGGDPSPLFDAPMHLRLSNGSGGAWAGSKQEPGEFVIDSVRVSK